MRRVVAYARVNSEEQRIRETISTLLEFVRGVVARDGLDIIQVYADDGVLGTILLEKRPAGARLIADARSGRLQAIVDYRRSVERSLKHSGFDVKDDPDPKGRMP